MARIRARKSEPCAAAMCSCRNRLHPADIQRSGRHRIDRSPTSLGTVTQPTAQADETPRQEREWPPAGERVIDLFHYRIRAQQIRRDVDCGANLLVQPGARNLA